MQIALAMLRDMSALAPFSLLADCAHVVGMLVVLKHDATHYTRVHERIVMSQGAEALPFLFGVVIYCYEGISMILPIQDAMRDKSKVRPTLNACCVLRPFSHTCAATCGRPELVQQCAIQACPELSPERVVRQLWLPEQ